MVREGLLVLSDSRISKDDVCAAIEHFDSSGHRGSMSKNENFSGNDFKEIASFNGCFYRLDVTL